MNEPVTTVVGNLADDPEMRFTDQSKAVCKFRVASTPRVRKGDQWEDGEPWFLTVTCWERLAEHVAASLKRGHQVVVCGTLRSRSWEDKDTGKKRSTVEMTAQAVGASLQFATVEITKSTGGNGGGRGQRGDEDWENASKERPAATAGATANTQRATQPVDDDPPW